MRTLLILGAFVAALWVAAAIVASGWTLGWVEGIVP